jgi:Truncated hemoglobins
MSAEKSLYERLGGVYAIAAVIDRFSDQLLKNPKIVSANPQLKEWHTKKYKTRLPGLKFNRTLWVAAITGGPYEYTAKDLHDAHLELQITPEVFDEVAAELASALDYFNVPKQEKQEVLDAFSAQKSDVIAGSMIAAGH